MPFIDALPFEALTADARAIYEREQQHYGFVPNYALLFGHRPELLERWARLQSSIKRHQDRRQFELVTFVAAVTLGSTLCSRAHGQALLEYLSREDVEALARGETPVSCSPADAAVIGLARTVARDANAVTREQIDALKGHGFGPGEILDMVATVAGRAFFSKIVEALGVEAHEEVRADDDLTRALTVGREPACLPPVRLRTSDTQK